MRWACPGTVDQADHAIVPARQEILRVVDATRVSKNMYSISPVDFHDTIKDATIAAFNTILRNEFDHGKVTSSSIKTIADDVIKRSEKISGVVENTASIKAMIASSPHDPVIIHGKAVESPFLSRRVAGKDPQGLSDALKRFSSVNRIVAIKSVLPSIGKDCFGG
jgi:hypothetical protein